jgi:hypothetical protein
MKATIFYIAVVMLFTSCKKMTETVLDKGLYTDHLPSKFIEYNIQQGNQFCDQSEYVPVEISEMNFAVRFDSSAIYQTIIPENQYDINKLFGFSDNNAEHHQYSARIGWAWNDNALRLYAYVYNKGIRHSKEIGMIPIGKTANCSIKIEGNLYLFTVNDTKLEMPRLSTTEKARGYQLYPYFGGNETAPHPINIWIRMIDEAK